MTRAIALSLMLCGCVDVTRRVIGPAPDAALRDGRPDVTDAARPEMQPDKARPPTDLAREGRLDVLASDLLKTDKASCIGLKQGGPTSCKDQAAWKLAAFQDCLNQGRELYSYELVDPCSASGFRYVTYLCCKP